MPLPEIKARPRRSGPTRDQRAVIKRQLILEGALRIVARHGYAGASIARIAAEAGIAHGSVYSHFATRRALLNALLPFEGRLMLDHVGAAVQGAGSYFELERRGFLAAAEYMEARPLFLRVLMEAEAAAPGSFGAHMEAVEDAYLRALHRGVSRAELRRQSDVALRVIADVLAGARGHVAIAMQTRAELEAGPPLPPWTADTYVRFIRHGLQAASARFSEPPPLDEEPPAAGDARDALLAAAASSIHARGFEATSVKIVTAHAGLSVGSFYTYFASPEAMLEDLLTRMRERLLRHVRRRAGGACSFAELEVRGFCAFFDFLRREPSFGRVESEAAVWTPEAYRAHFADLQGRHLAAMEEAGGVAGFERRELPVLAALFMASRHYLASRFPPETTDPATLAAMEAAYRDLVCHGLAAA